MVKLSRIATLAAVLISTSAAAQEFPTKPVTVIVATAPGSSMSNLARVVGDQLEKRWKQPVIIDNRAGGAGLIAAEYVSRAAPDGHTLVFASDAFTTFHIFTKGVTFDPQKDLAPVALISWSPYAMLTNAKVPAKTIESFIVYAKANPGKLNFGTIGRNPQLLAILRFNQLHGLKMEAVNYPATAQAVPALITDDIQLFLSGFATAGPHIKSGAMVPLAAMSDERIKEMPDVPTLKERGIDLTEGYWFGYMAPPATPKAITERISAAVQAALKTPEVADYYSKVGFTVLTGPPAHMAKTIAEDMRVRTAVAKAAGIEPE